MHGGGDYDQPIIYESQLSRRDICRLLYTIEQTGFFDLDFAKNDSDPTAPYRYEAALGDEQLKNLGEGGPSTTIKINAWRKVDVNLYMLGELLDVLCEASDVDAKTYVHPAISAVVEGIEEYRPHQLKLFQPAAVAISAGRVDGIPTGFISQSWPIRNIVLEKPPAEWPYVWIYRGPLAAQLYRQVLDNPYFYDRLDYHNVCVCIRCSHRLSY